MLERVKLMIANKVYHLGPLFKSILSFFLHSNPNEARNVFYLFNSFICHTILILVWFIVYESWKINIIIMFSVFRIIDKSIVCILHFQLKSVGLKYSKPESKFLRIIWMHDGSMCLVANLFRRNKLVWNSCNVAAACV